jgi:hypothetical protein
MAGSKAPAAVQGVSFVPLLRGETPGDWRRSIYYRYYDPAFGISPHYGLRTARYYHYALLYVNRLRF